MTATVRCSRNHAQSQSSFTAPREWKKCNKRLKQPSIFADNRSGSEVYNALVDPREAAQIALHTGTTERTVHQVISDYNRQGIEAIGFAASRRETETPGKGV
ncbi:MAG: hypothetical protein QNJ41_12610 [Xenococcaceae cyanobacterium MO_188.B32]|nr:hypothetical protein [Xenococcaceae cyanobacterium MO_188.B32]